jgi:hypothetical protein
MIRKKLSVIDKLSDYDIVLKKLNDIDVLKKLLLNDIQLSCFDYLEKPMNVHTNNLFSQSFNNLLINNTEEKRKNVIKEYAELYYCNKEDSINKKLYNALDDNFREEIDKIIGSMNKLNIA